MCVGNPMSLIDQGKEVPCPGPCVYKGPFKLFLACALSRGKELDPLQCIYIPCSWAPGMLELSVQRAPNTLSGLLPMFLLSRMDSFASLHIPVPNWWPMNR